MRWSVGDFCSYLIKTPFLKPTFIRNLFWSLSWWLACFHTSSFFCKLIVNVCVLTGSSVYHVHEIYNIYEEINKLFYEKLSYHEIEAPSTRIRINLKTQKYSFVFKEFRVHTLFFMNRFWRPHVNAETISKRKNPWLSMRRWWKSEV